MGINGSWEGHTEVNYFDAQHQVAPASEALTCGDCHVPDGRLDLAALGYDPEKAQALASLAAPTPADLPTTGAGLVALPLMLAGGLLAPGGGVC